MNRVNVVTDAPSPHTTRAATAASARSWPRRRVVALLAGLALVVGAIGMLCVGVLAAVASSGEYVDLGAHGTYHTDGYALTTGSTNWRTEWFGWTGSARVRVAPENEERIFVGVASPNAIDGYLSGTGYTTVSEDGDRTVHAGARPALPPARAIAWTAQSEGVRTQTLRWDAAKGSQVVFAMNADRSRPVHVRIVSSAVTLDRMPWWIPVGLLGLGIVLLAAAIVLLWRTIRRRHAVA